MGAKLELGILGPIEVRIDDATAALGGPRQRAVLAVLAIRPNQVVSVDRLVDDIWGENAPATAVHTIQVFVSRLRRALASAGDRLITRPPGYVLDLKLDELDADRFERLYKTGRASVDAGRAEDAVALLTQALALWRGPPLSDFTYEPFAQGAIARLDELRLGAREELIEAELAAGRHEHVVSELEVLIREHPFRERPRGQLMLALYRCGRQAQALEVFQETRRMLADELALDPSPVLQGLEQRILRQDPSLDAKPSRPAKARARHTESSRAIPDSAPVTEQPELAALVRKTVTVLVARLELPAKADPELARTWISLGRDEAERIIGRHGGMVVSRLGGEVIGVFGLPATREDDALRALRSAEELMVRVAELAEGELGAPVARAFVDTGEVVGEASSDLSGEPVSTALKLVHAANEFEVLFGHATQRLTSGAIQFDAALDGAAWRLLGPIADSPVLGRATRPMVDRRAEMVAARGAFERTMQPRGAQLLTVLGEAGIGKSRLAQELINELGRDATVLAGRCLSYGEGIAFWPLREALTQAAGGESRDAIRGLLDGVDEADVVADIVASMLGLAPAESAVEQVPWAFRRLLEVMASDRPVMLVLEDIHWGEGPLLDLVEYLIDWMTVPALLVCLARPELLDNRPGWGGGHERVSSLLLSPLDEADARLMLDQHLGDRRLSPAESAQLLEIAEGNPLFVEQLLRASAEDSLWGRESQVPATIQSLLAARLDRLGPGERAYIERAAVIGREFSPAAIVELLPSEARASAVGHLRSLVHRGLIHPDRSTVAGQEQLRFHHILIRDVAYHSTPKALRAELHERFADWLTRRDEQQDEFIGFHLEQAFRFRGEVGRPDAETLTLAVRGADHLAAAGRRALARWDTAAGIKLLIASADLAAAGGTMRPDVLLDLGTALRDSGRFGEAEAALDSALKQARLLADERVSTRAMIELSDLRVAAGSSVTVGEMIAVAEEAISVCERIGDEGGLSRALLHIAKAHWISCRCAEMEAVLERALTYAERAGHRQQRSRILSDLARATVTGPRAVEDGISRCKAILERAESDVIVTAVTEVMLSVLEAMRGEFDQARDRWKRSQQELEDIGLGVTVANLTMYRAFVELMAGTPGNAVAELTAAHDVLERLGEHDRLPTTAALLARVLYARGDYERSAHFARISREKASRDDVVSIVVGGGTHGKLLAREGRGKLAIGVATAGVDLAAETDFLMLHADSLADRAEVFAILGQPADALLNLNRATQIYKLKGMTISADAARRSAGALGSGSATPVR